MINEHGVIGGMRTGKQNQCSQKISALLLLCQSQIPHEPTLAQTLAAVIGQ